MSQIRSQSNYGTMDALKRLVRSRKALLALSAILVTLTLLATNQIEPGQASNTIGSLFVVLILSIMGEDIAEKVKR